MVKIRFCSVPFYDVLEHNLRLEASAFDMQAYYAYQCINCGKYSAITLGGELSPVSRIYYGSRLKRDYVGSALPNAVGFIGSSEMLDCYPRPVKFMKNSDNLKDLHVQYGDILMSRSGTVGNLTFVGKTLAKLLVSEHAIRIKCREYSGYVYAYLKSKIGQSLIASHIYGAVIQEIEPEHIASIPIPNPPEQLKQKIHNLIVKSYELRDESNNDINKATNLLIEELKLPPLEEIITNRRSFNVNFKDLEFRLDASYHIHIVNTIVEHMKKYAAEVTTIKDSRVSKDIILAGVFKRTYVEEDYGYPFLGGKEITQLSPKIEKFLSRAIHKSRYEKELKVEENMILVSDRGTIGITAFVPRHWDGWAVSQNVLKIVPVNNDIAGYLYIYLNSDIGHILVRRQTYGSVVDMIDNHSLEDVEIPLLKNAAIQKRINELALEANEKRYEAYKLEQEALKIIDEEIIK